MMSFSINYMEPDPSAEQREEAREAGGEFPHIYPFDNASDVYVQKETTFHEAFLEMFDFDPEHYVLVIGGDDGARTARTNEHIPPPGAKDDEVGEVNRYTVEHRLQLVHVGLRTLVESLK